MTTDRLFTLRRVPENDEIVTRLRRWFSGPTPDAIRRYGPFVVFKAEWSLPRSTQYVAVLEYGPGVLDPPATGSTLKRVEEDDRLTDLLDSLDAGVEESLVAYFVPEEK